MSSVREGQTSLRQTHKEQETFVLPDGSAAAQEAQQEQHAAHGQDDVDAGEQQGVGRHDLPEAHRVQQHPDADTQQEGATQLGERGFIIESERCLPQIFTVQKVQKGSDPPGKCWGRGVGRI